MDAKTYKYEKWRDEPPAKSPPPVRVMVSHDFHISSEAGMSKDEIPECLERVACEQRSTVNYEHVTLKIRISIEQRR